jgi:hypothetical protein
MIVWPRSTRSKCALISTAIVLCSGLTVIPNSDAGAASWTGFAGVIPNSSVQSPTGVQTYRYDSIPSNVATGAGYCSTLLGQNGDGSNQPFVYQNVVLAFPYQGYSMYDYFGTIHQCSGYEWWLFLNEYDASNGIFYSTFGDKSITGSSQHHYYEFINNSNSNDVMAAQVDNTVLWTSPQNGVLGTTVDAETLSTSQDAVTSYQGSQLNFNNDFQGWASFNLSSSDTINNGATNSSGNAAMCSYVVSPPGSQTANFGENTSNMTNCT